MGRQAGNADSSAPTTRELSIHLDTLLGAALCKNSQATYTRAWDLYNEFSRDCLGISPALPIATPTWALFLAYMFHLKLAPSTMRTYISALGYIHKICGLEDKSNSFQVQKLLHGAKCLNSSVDQRLPITEDILGRMIDSLPVVFSNPSIRLLYDTMFLVAFHRFFRIGELTVRSSDEEAALQVQDVSLSSSAAYLNISMYKHNSGKASKIVTLDKLDSNLCPVAALKRYLRQRPLFPGPLFCDRCFKPVARSSFNEALRVVFNFLRLDSTRYKGHSFRTGAACSAAKKGWSDAKIRQRGRWNSDAFKAYIRVQL
ncbi:uncharacterized protein [Haliotis cracherodii]|uniref:uncharacterized protein n=1 Tax=Haliotis cracherodii TaxID=6455 RepID=UPI0039E915A9